eukprot:gb/GFBE01065259.1/.p1 GENE.gb/GFBE01065259.1/~~gb/GFBE01065259.1/.p1  ORF type:complete len:122 (+),score=29.56 gb/GFBE01065259.1/:1-366(+)
MGHRHGREAAASYETGFIPQASNVTTDPSTHEHGANQFNDFFPSTTMRTFKKGTAFSDLQDNDVAARLSSSQRRTKIKNKRTSFNHQHEEHKEEEHKAKGTCPFGFCNGKKEDKHHGEHQK